MRFYHNTLTDWQQKKRKLFQNCCLSTSTAQHSCHFFNKLQNHRLALCNCRPLMSEISGTSETVWLLLWLWMLWVWDEINRISNQYAGTLYWNQGSEVKMNSSCSSSSSITILIIIITATMPTVAKVMEWYSTKPVFPKAWTNLRFKNEPQHKKTAALQSNIAITWQMEIRPYFTAKSVVFPSDLCGTYSTSPGFLPIKVQLANWSWKQEKYWMLLKSGLQRCLFSALVSEGYSSICQ